jgi:NADH:ubiquinone oxidoreductase subunit E
MQNLESVSEVKTIKTHYSMFNWAAEHSYTVNVCAAF